MSTELSTKHLLKIATATNEEIEYEPQIGNDPIDKNNDEDNGVSPLAFVALILITSLFLSAIIFQSNNNQHTNQHNHSYAVSSHHSNRPNNWPIAISTWHFTDAVEIAYDALLNTNDSIQGILAGCSYCEFNPWQCGWSVGYGGKPDSVGEVTLDALIMHGPSHSAGAVGQLRHIKNAIGVAHAVMKHTTHTLLVGESATKFAEMMGFQRESLSSRRSRTMYNIWKERDQCQPNSYLNLPDANTSCPPYLSGNVKKGYSDGDYAGYRRKGSGYMRTVGKYNHDTIGMIAVDANGYMTVGASTNGLRYKLHGRVGDSALVGHGAYVKQGIGGAVATGNGDIIMLYAPTRIAVYNMENGMDVQKACALAMKDITNDFPDFDGALICMDYHGNFAVSKNMDRAFHYVYKDASLHDAKLLKLS